MGRLTDEQIEELRAAGKRLADERTATDEPSLALDPVVFERGGVIYANSQDVAAFFGKDHKHVLRDVRALIELRPDWGGSNFGLSSYLSEQNKELPCFEMTRSGFSVLVMGFTGGDALTFKIKYDEQFCAMERALRNRAAGFAIPQTLSEALRLAADQADTIERQKSVIEAGKPKTDFYDRYANADGLYGLQNAARVLGQSPNKFVGTLKQGYLFYQGGALIPKVEYRERGIFEVKATDVDGKARFQTYVTPKGIQYFAKKLGADQLPLGLTH